MEWAIYHLEAEKEKENLSDRIAVVNEGKFLQIGTYDELDLESVKKSKF